MSKLTSVRNKPDLSLKYWLLEAKNLKFKNKRCIVNIKTFNAQEKIPKNCEAQCSGSYEYKCTTYPVDVSVYVVSLYQGHCA